MKIPWNEHRETVFTDRYAMKDTKGQAIEKSPEEMWFRVANAMALEEGELVEFVDLLSNFKFVPGGRILAGAGTKNQVTYFNCFVVPVRSTLPERGNDSRKGIMDTITMLVEITSRGGGVGINWSTLRPRGAHVKCVNGKSSGPISWMIAANGVLKQVEQGGTRRGAAMFMLNVWHPSIMEFIKIKEDLSLIDCANLSVGISDTFMDAVFNDLGWVTHFPDTTFEKYNSEWNGDIEEWIRKGYPIVDGPEYKAREIWDAICESAWRCGEPGIVWLDRYNKLSNTAKFEKIGCVNPCGEQGLGEWGVCNLGSINLVAHLMELNGEYMLDFEELRCTIASAVKFLDNAINLNEYINDEMKYKQLEIRRIGLGTMGLADVLLAQKIRYGSPESIKFIEELYEFIRDTAYDASIRLAQSKGPAPAFREDMMDRPFIETLPEHIREGIFTCGLRNLVLLTQAPTGTTSILAGASSGIEPIFDFSFIRKDRTGEHIVHELMFGVLVEQGIIDPKNLPSYAVTAHDLSPEEHVKVQSTIQRYVDSSISKTVNAPSIHTITEVDKLYRMAYDLGCKGVTYYRDGSREGVLRKIDEPKSKVKDPKKRPKKLSGETISESTPLGTMFLTLNKVDNEPFEVFCQVGKAGSEVAAFTEALARVSSAYLRGGGDVENLIEQLQGIGGSTTVGFGKNRVRSVPDAMAKALRKLCPKEEIIETDLSGADERTLNKVAYDICPQCGGASFAREEGCMKCASCGYSAC